MSTTIDIELGRAAGMALRDPARVAERAAIVAWLRSTGWDMAEGFADYIADGLHLIPPAPAAPPLPIFYGCAAPSFEVMREREAIEKYGPLASADLVEALIARFGSAEETSASERESSAG